MAIISWNVEADGDWQNKNNWDLVRKPVASDDVAIDTALTHTVTIHNDSKVHSLTVGNDNLKIVNSAVLTVTQQAGFGGDVTLESAGINLGGDATVSGMFTSSFFGKILGNGTLTTAGGMTINAWTVFGGHGTSILQQQTVLTAGQAWIDGGRLVENQGTLTIHDGASIAFESNPFGWFDATGGVLHNAAGATIVIDYSNAGVAIDRSVERSDMLINDGDFRFVGTGSANVEAYMQNNGTLTVTQGALGFACGLITSADALNISAGAALGLTSTTAINSEVLLPVTITGGTTHGKGTIATAGDVVFTGNTIIAGDLDDSFGDWSLEGNAVTIKGNFQADGLTSLAGEGRLSTSGGASIAAAVDLMDHSKLVLSGTSIVTGDGGFIVEGKSTVQNSGTLTSTTNAPLFYLGYNPNHGSGGVDTATIENAVGARLTFDYSTDSVAIASGAGHTTIANSGWIFLEGTGNLEFDAELFLNYGSIRIDRGSLTVHATNGGTVYVATGAKFVLDAPAATDACNLSVSGGGAVDISGGLANDFYSFNDKNFSAADHINGGAGYDRLYLDGIAGKKLICNSTTITGVEEIHLYGAHSYKIVTDDANVAAGERLFIDGSGLGSRDTLAVNGAAESDGSLDLIGGAGNDSLRGGAGADVFQGGLGADTIYAHGADRFSFPDVAQSTGVAYDTLHGVDFAIDQFEVRFTVAAIDASIMGGNVSKASIDADLATLLPESALGARHAVLVAPDSGNLAGHLFLVVDANGVAGYQADKEFVMDVTGAKHLQALDTHDFA